MQPITSVEVLEDKFSAVTKHKSGKGKSQGFPMQPLTSVEVHEDKFSAVTKHKSGKGKSQGHNQHVLLKETIINSVNTVFCASQLYFANSGNNALNVIHNPHVETKITKFWKTSILLGANSKVVTLISEGYTLLFQFRPI